MKITPDDPKLTAYALGELDKSERAAIEAELEKSAECRRAVEEIRETAAVLEKNLATEELPELAFAQQRKIENQLKESVGRSKTSGWRFLLYGGMSAAAACLIATMLLPALSSSKHEAQQVALNSQRQLQELTKSVPPAPAGAMTPAPPEPTLKNPVVTPPVLVSGSIAPTTKTDAENNFVATAPISAPVATLALSTPALTPPDNNKAAPKPGMIAGSSVNANTPNSASDGFYLGAAKSGTTGSGTLTVNGGSAPQSVPGVVALNGVNNYGVIGGGGRGGGIGGGGGGGRGADLSGTSADQNMYYRSVNQVVAGESRAKVPALGDIPLQGRLFRSPSQIDTASYPHLIENSFLTALNHPLSTFSIDVDTASYANVRRFLNEGRMPPPDAVRIEEMVNYFKYNYPQPRGEDPFAANIEIAGCPWNSGHRLVRIGLKGREIAQDKRPPSNFVFLIDVSGSMQPPERLPLIKQALRQLVKKMTENDRVAIVVYASNAGIKLESTSCSEKEKILQAIDELDAGGSTAGAAGIQTAYRVAQKNFIEGGVNRVLLCTDGDFNVGITDQGQLVKMIQDKARSGVSLTTLGVGTDNYKDALMQKLADKGNGNYAYLDTLEEAQKVLIEQMSGTLVTIAKDVKIQIEFNPAQVSAYRLIGYEKRMLRKEDFNNDAKDAGEIGAGHTVTALYEIVPAGGEIRAGEVDDLKYQHPAEEKPERYVSDGSKELLTLKLRYKQPDGDKSRLLEFPVTDNGRRLGRASSDFKFAAAVAEFGMLLRDSEFKGSSSYGAVLELAGEAKGADAEGYRSEFLNLVRKARELQP
ncbi:MAG TPA: von Willebrand factor type A domain-containing protein [Verrucomicrobiae bacterium]